MKLNIIIPFYHNETTIEPLIMSIMDQDFKDLDVTIVQDGPHPQETVDLLVGLVQKYNVMYEQLPENKGASAARNYGARISAENMLYDNKGNYLLFMDADCMLYPGMLRAMATKLDDNLAIQFVYGDYRFDHKHEFHSQKFDPYLLETMNYICTMSMMRREAYEAVQGFPEDRPYFQDWGIFYSMAKAGLKGEYLPRFIFTTTTSTADNISGKTELSLADKAAEFRKYYGIEDKRLAVTTFGAPLQAIQRAKMLNADYVGPAIDSRRQVFPVNYGFKNWEGTYIVGCYNAPFEALENHLAAMVGKKIIHFIGTDVQQLYHEHSVASVFAIRDELKATGAKVFANSPRMVREMQALGFNVELLYTPIYDFAQYKPSALPEQFTVGVYFSDTNPMHAIECEEPGHPSNVPLIVDVARSMPDVKFIFFGGAARYSAKDTEKKVPENIEFVGKYPEERMSELIKRCSMTVRSTIHDGFPQLPIQFMLSGRSALVSCPDEEMRYADKLSFEYPTFYEKCKEEMINKIYEIADRKVDPKALSKQAHEYYESLMSVEDFKEKVYAAL